MKLMKKAADKVCFPLVLLSSKIGPLGSTCFCWTWSETFGSDSKFDMKWITIMICVIKECVLSLSYFT